MKTMCPPVVIMATHTLGHMIWNTHESASCA